MVKSLKTQKSLEDIPFISLCVVRKEKTEFRTCVCIYINVSSGTYQSVDVDNAGN